MNQSKDHIYLQGGRENQIVQIDNCVHRPAGSWSKEVHRFLHHLRQQGFFNAPEPFGFDAEGKEILSFIKGEVSNLLKGASSIKTLTSAAKLLRHYHDASERFLSTLPSNHCSIWQLPYRDPLEVMCHGDFAPYNVVLNGEEAIGIIDFDTCHPGPRTWDIAYALYRWAPFTDPSNEEGFGSIKDQIARAQLFSDAYGLAQKDRKNMGNLIIERLQALVNFMYDQAKAGNEACKLALKQQHDLIYLKDIEYIKTNKTLIEKSFD